MNLESLIQFLLDNKERRIDELTDEGIDFDKNTTTRMELSFEEIDAIVEILSAVADVEFVDEDEDYEDEE